jgi:hypothetical protein
VDQPDAEFAVSSVTPVRSRPRPSLRPRREARWLGVNGSSSVGVSVTVDGVRFVDQVQPAIGLDEVLVQIRVPRMPGADEPVREGPAHGPVLGLVGAAAAARRENGAIAEARFALTKHGTEPLRKCF